MIKYEADRGCIRVDEDVFTTIVADAVTGCFGVNGLLEKSLADGVLRLVNKDTMRRGVYVSYNSDLTISIELHIMVHHGVNIPETCRNIIEEVRYKVLTATGVKLKNVDVYVDAASGD